MTEYKKQADDSAADKSIIPLNLFQSYTFINVPDVYLIIPLKRSAKQILNRIHVSVKAS